MSTSSYANQTSMAQEEVIATAKLLLPLITSRLETDRDWALSMLNTIQAGLKLAPSTSTHPQTLETSAISNVSPLAALGLAHNLAENDELPAAAAMAQLALADPEALEDKQANARVLLASLLERQGDFETAAHHIGAARSLAPADDGILNDQIRILSSLRVSIDQSISAEPSEKARSLATLLKFGGWNRSDAIQLLRATIKLLARRK